MGAVRMRPFFSYYGAKWRAAPYYPAPMHKQIIEPFAGSACYALLYPERDVLLVDLDETIAGIWRWLISASYDDVMALPDVVESLETIDPSIPQAAKDLMCFWFVKGSTRPVTKPYAWMRAGEWADQFWGPQIKRRIASQVRRIRHWEIICADYRTVENRTATWFIDPPYADKGRHYNCNDVDYTSLAAWCGERLGQIIICEQEGADWLPFQRLKTVKALKARTSAEVMFTRGGDLFSEA